MLDKYLKIFGLDNNFSLDELEGKYKSLLKEFDTKNIEDDLKIIFLEEQVKIREAYQILLKFNHTREKVSSIKSKGNTLDDKPKPERKKRNSYVALAISFVVILVILGFFFKDNIKGWLPAPTSWVCFEDSCKELSNGNGDYSSQTDCENSCGAVEKKKVVFDGQAFINMSTKDTIKNVDSLFTCFKESIYFKVDDASYTLYFEDDEWKIFTDKVERLKVDALKELKVKIEKDNPLADTKKIVDHINKVIQYTKLRFEGGLEDDDTKKIWKIDGIYLEYIISNTNEFTKYKKNIKDNKKLKAFLEKNLPKNIFDALIKVHTEFKKNVKDNKTIKKTVPQKLDKQDKKLACTLTEEHKGNYYWLKIIRQIGRMTGLENKKDDLEVIVNRESATIASYRDCGCPKCKNVLKDGNLKKVQVYLKTQIEIEEEDDEEFFMVVENMPEFPGGDLGLMKYIQKNVKYPAIAKEYNITGKVYVSFIVDKKGSVTNVKIVRGVDKNLDAEAMRVVKSLPKYKPGNSGGKSVRVMFTIPINFTLNK